MLRHPLEVEPRKCTEGACIGNVVLSLQEPGPATPPAGGRYKALHAGCMLLHMQALASSSTGALQVSARGPLQVPSRGRPEGLYRCLQR